MVWRHNANAIHERIAPRTSAEIPYRSPNSPTATGSSVAATLLPVAFGLFGLVYGISALVLGAILSWMAFALWRQTTRRHAVSLFHYSMLYLALLFVAMALDSVV